MTSDVYKYSVRKNSNNLSDFFSFFLFFCKYLHPSLQLPSLCCANTKLLLTAGELGWDSCHRVKRARFPMRQNSGRAAAAAALEATQDANGRRV